MSPSRNIKRSPFCQRRWRCQAWFNFALALDPYLRLPGSQGYNQSEQWTDAYKDSEKPAMKSCEFMPPFPDTEASVLSNFFCDPTKQDASGKIRADAQNHQNGNAQHEVPC
mmetsp:Transcript_9211/g.17616  ORF Transcript_9211/g.17616 Transcript_9211/m.17616 type:complete len:111 (-) Transcript_9211:47-379(-)